MRSNRDPYPYHRMMNEPRWFRPPPPAKKTPRWKTWLLFASTYTLAMAVIVAFIKLCARLAS